MKTRGVIGASLAMLIVATAPVSVAMAGHEIVIESTKLNPPVYQATVGERVTFVNRSGRPVHVDFLGNAGRHRLFQVSDEIWAIFHRPGLHPFEVHFADPKAATLHGRVEAVEVPAGQGDLPICESLTVMGVCIEP